MAAPKSKRSAEPAPLFPGGIRALNVGVSEFALSPRAHGATVLELDWRPPAGGDRDLGLLLARLEDDPDDPIGSQVAAANAQAIERILEVRKVIGSPGFPLDEQDIRDRAGRVDVTFTPTVPGEYPFFCTNSEMKS